MGKTYRISLDVGGLTLLTNPTYDKLIIQEERPDGEVFLRPKLETELTFHRWDYDYLDLAVSIDQEIIVFVELLEPGGAYTVKYTGVFTKTDCEWNGDDRTCKVKPRTRDDYEKIMEGLNKEFNLINLAPPLTSISYDKKPVIQAYLFDSNVVSNFQQGNYWESPVIAGDVTAITLVSSYYFTLGSDFIYIPGDATINPNVSGKYSVSTGYREDGLYRVKNESGKVVIEIASTGVNVYEGVSGEAFLNPTNFLAPAGSLTSTVDGVSKVQGFRISVYLRYYTDKEDITGVPTFPIPDNDIVANNSNYTRVIGLSADNVAAYSGHSANPTPYGTFSTTADNFSGEYFTLYPAQGTPFVGAAYPLARSEWSYYSLWFQFTSFLTGVESDYSTAITIYDAYKLPDVINAFLGELDPVITHSESSTYSGFFYTTSNPIRGTKTYPIITPKSNVLIGNYDQPAKKAPLRFGELLQYLKDFYKVYWYVRNGMFILEHLEYFEKGGSYTMDQIGVDLTTDKETKTGKTWAFKTNKYTYEKTEMPERIEMAYMDNQSPVFEGHPIVMLDNRVDKGNIQTKSLSKFSNDVDFITTSPGEISNNGFVFFECGKLSGEYYVPSVEIDFEGIILNVHNGYAAIPYAHNQYHKYQLPCANVRINNETTTATSVIKTKVQEVYFPSDPVPSDIELITTSLGNGKVKSREINLLSGMIKTILHHDQ